MENKKESINDPTLKLCDIDFSKIPKPDDFRNVKVNSNIKWKNIGLTFGILLFCTGIGAAIMFLIIYFCNK